MQIPAVRAFQRFATKAGLNAKALHAAADEIARGLWHADLGGGLIKKRVARPGQGRRGGFRVIVAWRHGDRLVFLFGFAKNEAATLTDAGRQALMKLGEAYLRATPAQIAALLADGAMTEVKHDG